MKKILFSFTLFLASVITHAQDITGQWNGMLKVQGMQLPLVFHVSKNDSGYSSTMDSPDQKAFGIPVTTTTFESPDKIKFAVSNAGIDYSGELKGEEITGTFKQAGQEFPLTLSRKTIEKEIPKRPQEPVKPYPYVAEEVTFKNTKANITLAGTLSMPGKKSDLPAVILITGSGPQNRDEELMGHKPFLVISDYLTRHGIAVLRFDDRGIGQSTGDFKSATSADFATDVESALAYLKTRPEINKKKIGLMGHSEGGMIAPMVAASSKDIDFIVLLAGTGIKGDELLLLQQELIGRVSGMSEDAIKASRKDNAEVFSIVNASTDTQKLKTDLTKLINKSMSGFKTDDLPEGMTLEEYVAMQVNQIASPWMVYFIKYNPATALEKVKCPVLAVNGEKDLQVPPKQNLKAIEDALKKGGNKNVTTKEFPNLNHLFQECKTGAPSEYAEIEQTFSPIVLDEVTNWINKQTK